MSFYNSADLVNSSFTEMEPGGFPIGHYLFGLAHQTVQRCFFFHGRILSFRQGSYCQLSDFLKISTAAMTTNTMVSAAWE